MKKLCPWVISLSLIIYNVLHSLTNWVPVNINKKLIDGSINVIELKEDLKREYNIIAIELKISSNEIQLKSNFRTQKLTIILTNFENNQYVESIIGNFYKLK